MDLELNFAAPDAAGGRKKAKSRGQQQQRGKSRQNGFKAAGGARTAVTASSSSAQAQNGAGRRTDQQSEPPRGDRQPSSRSPAKSAAKRQDRPARDVDGVPVASTSNAIDSTSQPQSGKRQVISSLFPRPAGPRPAGADATAGDAKKKDKKDTPAVLDPSNAPSLADDFGSMALRPALVAHLKGKMGLAHPTTVQKLAVPFLCDPAASNKDALLQAQTGSGKTLAYLLPIIEDLLRVADECKKNGTPLDRNVGTLAIILAPTRELANQIAEVATKLLSFSVEPGSASQRWITPGLLTGGAHRQHEKARLRKGVPLLIATPGRLLDHLEATKAFRIAGETMRKPKDPSRGGRANGSDIDSEDEFAYEDDIAPIAGPSDKADEISSDEDFEGKGVSRSHRRNEPLSAGAASIVNPRLVLRWLVLDEADRLMDMGFEPQIESITKLLQTRLDKRTAALARAINRGTVRNRLSGQKGQRIDLDQRRTLLCSATIQENVQKLAGDTLRDPLLIKGDNESGKSSQRTSASEEKQAYAPPSQLAQHYTIVEPKLRFVTLVALLRHLLMHSGPAKTHQKILVFLSCTDSVDLHWNALVGLRMGQEESTAPKKSKNKGENTKLGGTTQLLPGTSVYRLHGSLDLKTRLESLKGFSATQQESAILLCTSVAARGLDVPDVSSVVQYDLPTEGGVNEYIHRVGRTARAGALGQSWVFLLPSETGWVDWAETSMQKDDAGPLSKRLQDESTEALLKLGYGGKSARDYETRATDVQMAYERWVADDTANTNLAKTAFSSHVRAYATHPSAEKHIFHVKNLHLGHLAKAFGLREAPAGIGGGVGKMPRNGLQQGKRGKRKHEEVAAESSEEDGDAPKRKTIPRSGRALEGKGLHGPHATTRRDFNIAGTDAIKAMLNRKKN